MTPLIPLLPLHGHQFSAPQCIAFPAQVPTEPLLRWVGLPVRALLIMDWRLRQGITGVSPRFEMGLKSEVQWKPLGSPAPALRPASNPAAVLSLTQCND